LSGNLTLDWNPIGNAINGVISFFVGIFKGLFGVQGDIPSETILLAIALIVIVLLTFFYFWRKHSTGFDSAPKV
jgi:high-affinity Fe2+/Pb2+ permease